MEFREDVGGFLPRITNHDCRAIEQALAGPSLFDPGLRLEGAVVEASFAAREHPLLDRLREAGTPYLVDPQTIRFATETYLSVEALAKLAYAPTSPLAPESLDASARRAFVREVLLFQQKAGASAYMVPALPAMAAGPPVALNLAFLGDATDLNGSFVELKPLVAMLVPGRTVMASADQLIKPLADLPLEAAYIQPIRLHPTRDGIEQLVKYVTFLLAVTDLGLPVVAGRVGAFGLVLAAMGVGFFDSGLGDAESFDLGQLNRPRKRNPNSKFGGGRNRRIYLEALKTTLIQKHASAVLDEDTGLRSRFVCDLRCCRFKGFEGLADRRREHYLHVRSSEVARLRAEPTASMKLHRIHEHLVEAREHAEVVQRVLKSRGVEAPRFDHLDRWLGCLARIAGISTAA